MLPLFRRFIRSRFGAVIALLFLSLIAFAFVAGDLTSGQNSLSGLLSGGDTVAKAGGTKLSGTELRDRIQRAFDTARKSNPGIQMDDFFAQGGGDAIFDQLVAAITLKQFAKDEGVAISKRLVDAQIAQIPAFQDAAGNFSQDQFRQLLSRERITEAALRDDIIREILEKQMVAPVGLGVKLTDSMVLPYASLLLEARQGTIAAIPAVAFLDDKTPTDAQLADYYKRNADRFTVPEQRKVRYAIIDAARFMQAAQPSDAEISAYYNQNKAQYAAKELRSFEQLILPTQAGAKAIADQVKGGKSLAQAAQGAGLSVATLKDQTRAALAAEASDAVAAAGFATAQGGIAGPVRGSLGWVVLKVTAVQTTPQQSLESVKGTIVETLRAQKQKAMLADFTGKLEDQVANGATLDEIAKDNGLALAVTPLLLSTGQSPDDATFKPSDELKPLLAPVFGMSADDDPQLVPIVPDSRYALVAPGEIKAAAPPPIAKVKDAILAQYKLNQGNEKAKALADKIKAAVAKGQKLDAAIAAAGVKLPPVQVLGGRRADLMRGEQRPPAEVAILFSMAQNSVKSLPMGQDRGYFVVQLNAIKHTDAAGQPELVKQVREQLGTVVGDEYSRQFVRAIEKDMGVTRKADAVAQARKALTSADPQVQ